MAAASLPESLRWRVGRKAERTIYAQVGYEPSDDDLLIGLMDTPQLAADVVDAHNAALAKPDQGSASQ